MSAAARAPRRPLRRGAAALATAAIVVPLVAVGSGPAAASPAGRVTDNGDTTCNVATPKLINQTPPALLQLGATTAHTVATGKGVVVAVVDSGVAADNVHLRTAVLPGQDLSGANAPNGQIDLSGHGTAIAGEIAARPVQGSGVVGLAPDAMILPIRVYTAESGGTNGASQFPPSVAGITRGILAAAAAGAKIINVSMSTTTNDPTLAAAVATATSEGALIVASAGNRQKSEDKTNSPRYPGAYPQVLAVAAVDGSGQVTDDSIHGSYVDVAAPGVDILTTYYGAGDCQLSTDSASTSYATAYVSATAALIAQAHPDETPAQWRYRLESTALRVRPDTRDDDAGWGVIQPYEALTSVFDGTAPGPPDPAVTTSASPSAVARAIAPVAATTVDTTARNQTLWATFAGVLVVLALALVALLRRDRKQDVSRPPRTPAGAR